MATVKTTKKASADTRIEIDSINLVQGVADFYIEGRSPFICAAMSAKAKGELLSPRGKKTAADKAAKPKHVPEEEFMESFYRSMVDESPTLIMMKSTAFKSAIMGAALDIPGAQRTQIGRLLYVEGDYVPIFGIPKMMMSVVRSANMNKTPDIRTRAIIPHWATHIRVRFMQPHLNVKTVTMLLGAGGMTQGVGDWRVEKGSGNYGTFEVVDPYSVSFKTIVENGGREAQMEAIKVREPYDSETEELYSWYLEEMERRGTNTLKAVKGGKA